MKTLAAIVIVLVCGTFNFYATDNASHAVTLSVTEVCSLRLNSTAGISLNTTMPGAGGGLPQGNTDASKSLRYTSIVPSGGSRKITANWGAFDRAPSGTSLLLRVTSVPAGSGTPAGQIRLSNEPRSIITGIGSCATGSAAAALLYTFQVEDVNSLVQGDTRTVVINFTLTDAS